ncbi:MAG: family 1 glycosylhydrolase [Coriobacteriia bacterium]|nr:family 1 glycosylhydrolase [Coriobacteriia bacterium]
MSDALHSDGQLHFPGGFTWGAGISAHQVEGENRHNDWWAFEQQGKVAHSHFSGRATDHYNRFDEDFAIAESLGLSAVKISIEWSRIERERGVYDQDEIAHYVQVVKSARSHGLSPYVTLHHFSNPHWLGAYGWWEGTSTPALFAEFVRAVVVPLEPWVDTWITINEPMLLASAGYLFGMWPPERKGWASAWRVARNLVRAHRLAYEAIHELDTVCRVGAAVNVTALKHPGRPTLRDRLLGGWVDWVANYYFIDHVKDRSDFVGVQYYTRATVQQLLAGDPMALPTGMRPLPKTDMGWEIYPKGLYYTVRSMAKRSGKPIIVTENGIADAADERREDFIVEHLQWLHRAIEEGCDVRGYFHWALTDNFEWREGFEPCFGLVAIDYLTLKRTVRPSARTYERICRQNAVPAPVKR